MPDDRTPLLVTLLLAVTVLLAAACSSAPPYQGMDADQLMAVAEREFAEEDWEDVRTAVNRLLVNFPRYERLPEARHLLARAHFQDGEYVSAASEWTRLLDRYPTHELAPEAALGVCRANAELSPIPERDQTYTEQAMAICRNVAQDYPGTMAAVRAAEISNEMRGKLAESLYIVADYYFDRDLYDSAVIYFDMVDERFSDTKWAPRAVLGIMRAYEQIGYDDLAEDARARLLNVYGDSPEARTVREALADDDNGAPAGDTAGVALSAPGR